MKIHHVLGAAGIILAGGFVAHYVSDLSVKNSENRALLPSQTEATTALNTTQLHREWINIPVANSSIRVFVVYPGRADLAPVVVMTSKRESASQPLRAMALKVAEAGYIVVVPDILSGMAPKGGDSDSFSNDEMIADALHRMDKGDVAHRIEAAREYAIALPAANGRNASLVLDTVGRRIESEVEMPQAKDAQARFVLSSNGWTQAVAFLTKQTGNHPIIGSNPNVPEDHSMHMGHVGMAMAQATTQAQGAADGRGYPVGKSPNLPAGIYTAQTTLLDSKLRREFVEIPMGDAKLRTWVEYPAGDGKAPILVVMQHGPGMDDWQRAAADQLSQQGFITISPDLHSGLGPNGGAYESFRGTDEVMRATARINQDEMQRRYKIALEWGKKLPRWNGKVASIGFCMGGGNSFRFAGEVPDIDAAVVFYGGSTPSEQIMAKIKAPVLAFYGEDDARVTALAEPASIAMKKLGKSFEYHIYPHATHGFLEYQDLAGNPTATSDSWARTIEFLKKYTM